MSNENALSDFLKNPSNASKIILKIAQEEQNNIDSLFSKKGFIKSIISGVKVRLWYTNKYVEIYDFINNFKTDKGHNIKEQLNDLRRVFKKIALNNLLLTYASLTEKDTISKIETKEDLKLKYLNQLATKSISEEDFKNKFGHYAINPFELESKRFSEMEQTELMGIAQLLHHFKPVKKETLKKQISNNPQYKFPIYSALREELKYCALKIISEIRLKCIKLQNENKINNIFNLNYKEIVKLEDGS